ncbi:hypothetical protein KLEB273_gp237 [Bacillus phage vB_BauM_KLEB27-3]|nr:hypothetical protein KLEB273_gp237 [Bacillus phage vB_BauM_KLEB27-3]
MILQISLSYILFIVFSLLSIYFFIKSGLDCSTSKKETVKEKIYGALFVYCFIISTLTLITLIHYH